QISIFNTGIQCMLGFKRYPKIPPTLQVRKSYFMGELAAGRKTIESAGRRPQNHTAYSGQVFSPLFTAGRQRIPS
ncbi:hypothetical protein, partial [Megasphaera sp.]|uniref:hypothetical protein n=1 Tax=Megasphaera sp. TaxID=2023260 RepID=UPI004026C12D